MNNERNEALQAVVDRVSAYQESAPEATVDKELREALTETDLEVSDEEITTLVRAIEEPGEVSVTELIG